jgi:hypothetical protein
MSVDVITLGKEGTIADVDRKVDYLMCCYFFSKHSQTTFYLGQVSSLTKIIQMYGDDAIDIQRELQLDLQEFLQKFFTSVQVEISVDDVEPGISLQIDAIVSDGESINTNPTSVGYSLSINNSKLKSIVNMTNEVTIYNAA